MAEPVKRGAWDELRAATPARVGLGRAGDSIPTGAHLDFQLAHALARDAVHGEVDFDALAKAVKGPTVRVRSAAQDRATYLRRPDLGRRLAQSPLPSGPFDLVFVIADGLSAAAVERHAVPMLEASLARLPDLTIGPVVLASQARVALADEIGEAMGAKVTVILIGERPGLSVANSLGVYVTYDPRKGRRDSERNCISNIHASGLSYARAAEVLEWLVRQAMARGLTGVELKAETEPRSMGF